jgi:hypothetical protein
MAFAIPNGIYGGGQSICDGLTIDLDQYRAAAEQEIYADRIANNQRSCGFYWAPQVGTRATTTSRHRGEV